jgi:hypothetical protein
MSNLVQSMLTENTGRAMCDSGDFYGRNWERNQGRNFEAEPAASVRFSIGTWRGQPELEASVTLNVFHFLDRCASPAERLDKLFQRFAALPRNEREGWPSIMEAFVARLRSHGFEVTGLYGDGEPMMVNTYNGEDCLSQVLQYLYFEVEGHGPFAIVQVHGGCDVRGGYSTPHVFEVFSDENSLWDNARCALYEDGADWSWSSDDAGSHWEPGSYSQPADLFGQTWAMSPRLEDLPLSDDESKIGDGIHLVVTDDGRAFSPRGFEIKASPY